MLNATSVDLLRRVNSHESGDVGNAWSEFLSHYEQMIRRWLAGGGTAADDIDDVMQEIMTFVHRELPKFVHNGRTGAFRSWLRQVTMNRLREFRRKHRRHRSCVDLGAFANQIADEQSEINRLWNQEHSRFVVAQLLQRAAERFRPQTLSVFEEVAIKRRSASAVAAEFQISIGAVRVAQSRVLRALGEIAQEMQYR